MPAHEAHYWHAALWHWPYPLSMLICSNQPPSAQLAGKQHNKGAGKCPGKVVLLVMKTALCLSQPHWAALTPVQIISIHVGECKAACIGQHVLDALTCKHAQRYFNM